MARRLFAFSILCLSLSGATAEAADYKRVVNIEWEVIEAAKTYDFELTPIDGTSKGLLTKTAAAEWSGPLSPGAYRMRIRARDRRNAPGEWSPAEDFLVNLEKAKLTAPKSQEQIKSNEALEVETQLQWQEVGGAKEYVVEVQSEDGSFNTSQVVSDNKFSLKLPVAKKYTWKVLGRASEKIQGDALAMDEFSLIGKKLESPQVTPPKSEFVRELKWTTPENAQDYDYVVSRQDPKTQKWEQVSLVKDSKPNEMKFDRKWRGGKYKFVVRAKAGLRENSDKTEIQFPVFDGNRSPASEYTHTLRQAFDRTTGWFGIASYLVTSISYSGVNHDENGASSYSALGGTGRFGLGYLSPESNWGLLGIADYSGFTVDDKTFNFASAEGNVIYRQITTGRSESRHIFGTFYKELPVILGDGLGNYLGTEKIASTGPHYGYEYWYAMTPKVGLQVNAHAYLSLFKVKTPNDKKIKESLSYQLGLLGSYRFNPTTTGLMGYAYRVDQIGYKSIYDNAGDNTVKIEGHYLNLFLEWAL